LDHLEAKGLLENTVILFTSDHGESIGSHGGLTDKGWHHFEEAHRIPLIARFPHQRGAGQTRSQFMSLADVYPTILDLAGVPVEKGTVHGQSFLPLLENDKAPWRNTVVSEFGGVVSVAMTQRTLRHRHWKYGYTFGGGEELYDLQQDPWETSNLLHHPDYVDIANDLRQRLCRWMRETRDPTIYLYQRNLSYHGLDN